MNRRILATYRNGVFVPERPCHLPEETAVEIVVEKWSVEPPLVTDDEERRRILDGVVARMRRNPLPPSAPQFTREDLHERR